MFQVDRFLVFLTLFPFIDRWITFILFYILLLVFEILIIIIILVSFVNPFVDCNDCTTTVEHVDVR